MLDGGGHHLLGGGQLDGVVQADLGLPAGGGDQLGGLVRGVGVDVVDDDVRAVGGEPDGGGPADAAPGPCDDGNPVIEASHGVSSCGSAIGGRMPYRDRNAAKPPPDEGAASARTQVG